MTNMKKILIVDDSAAQRGRSVKALRGRPYTIYEAEDGIDAVQMFRSVRPDLTIMDNNMPIMEGIDAIRYIKKVDKNALIIMCSAVDDEKIIMEAIRAGAKDYIIKPVKKELLLKIVETYLKTGNGTENSR